MMIPDNIVDKEHLTMDSEVLGRSEEKWFALALGCDGNADCGEKSIFQDFGKGIFPKRSWIQVSKVRLHVQLEGPTTRKYTHIILLIQILLHYELEMWWEYNDKHMPQMLVSPNLHLQIAVCVCHSHSILSSKHIASFVSCALDSPVDNQSTSQYSYTIS